MGSWWMNGDDGDIVGGLELVWFGDLCGLCELCVLGGEHRGSCKPS